LSASLRGEHRHCGNYRTFTDLTVALDFNGNSRNKSLPSMKFTAYELTQIFYS
jgi:hypothetical protein